MDITEVPFNRFLGIEHADGQEGDLLKLAESQSLLNHLGTVHAGAQLALAEASSAECLLRTFPNLESGVLAVVRRVEAKFKNALRGVIGSRATINQDDQQAFAAALSSKGRGKVAVSVDVVDTAGTVGMSSSFEWFIRLA